MEVYQVNPSSWQPMLCMVFAEELSALSGQEAILAYLHGQRAKTILEILSMAEWKRLVNAASLLKEFMKAWKAVTDTLSHATFDASDYVCLYEFDALLSSENDNSFQCSELNFQQHSCLCAHDATAVEPKCQKRRRLRTRKELEESYRKHARLTHKGQNSDSDVDGANLTQQDIRRARQAAKFLSAPIVQEDSDGFPACWCDDADAEDQRTPVDDIVLPLIRAALPKKLQLDDDPAIIAVLLLRVIRRTLSFMKSDSDVDAADQFARMFLTTLSEQTLLPIAGDRSVAEDGRNDGTAVVRLKRQLLTRRHGLLSLLSALMRPGAKVYEETVSKATQLLLDNLVCICQSLSAAPTAVQHLELFGAEGCMEYMLETAADLASGILRLIAWVLSSTTGWKGGVKERLGHDALLGRLEISSTLLSACQQASLDDMIRDIFIGLDLLASVNFSDSTNDNRNSAGGKPDLNNAYYRKLCEILTRVVTVVVGTQYFNAMRVHVATCRNAHHQNCCLGKLYRHHGTLRSWSSTASDSSRVGIGVVCTVEYLENVIFICLRNVAGYESKQACISALEYFPSCCCLSEEAMITRFVEELIELPPDGRCLLLKCLENKLASRFSDCRTASTCISCHTGEGSSEEILLKSRRWSETDALLVAWKVFADKDYLQSQEEFFWVIARFFDRLSAPTKQKLVYAAILPILADRCTSCDLQSNNALSSRSSTFLQCLITLCKTGVGGPECYKRAVDILLPLADALIYHPDTRSSSLDLLRKIAIIESEIFVARHQHADFDLTFNRYLFGKFSVVAKLFLNDSQNFVSGSASDFWLTSTLLLETCRCLIRHSDGFQLLFADLGGFAQAFRVIETNVQLLGSYSNFAVDGESKKSLQRLAELLAQTVALCLESSVGQERMETVLKSLTSLYNRSESTLIDSHILLPVAKHCLDVVLLQNEFDRSDMLQESGAGCSIQLCSDIINDIPPDVDDHGYSADNENFLYDQGKESTRNVTKLPVVQPAQCRARICKICLQLLMKSSSVDKCSSASGAMLIRKLMHHCVGSSDLVKSLIADGFVDTLVELIQKSIDNDHQNPMIRAIIELIFELFKLCPKEVNLKPTLRLFNERNGSFQSIIISCLSCICAEIPFEPNCALNFPVDPLIIETSSGSKSSTMKRARSASPKKLLSSTNLTLSNDTRKSTFAIASPFAPLWTGLSSLFGGGIGSGKSSTKSMSRATTSATVGDMGKLLEKSPAHEKSDFPKWCDAAAAVCLDNVGCFISKGLSISMWIQLLSGETYQSELLHLLTVGDDILSCSLLIHPVKKSIVVQLSCCRTLVGEHERKGFIPSNCWTHLFFTARVMHEALVIKVIVDGARDASWKFRWHSGAYDPTTLHVSFGCLSDLTRKPKPIYRIGNIAGFRGEMSLEHAIAMRTLGPRCISVVDTKSRCLVGNMASRLNVALLQKELKLSALLEDGLGLIESLQKNAAFVYWPGQPDRVAIYNKLEAESSHASSAVESPLCRFVPFHRDCQKRCNFASFSKFTVDDALATLGGLKLYIFLFARCVEYEQNEATQASALSLLLQMASKNPELWRLFIELQCYDIIARVLASSSCRRGYALLESIFQFSLNVSVIQAEAGSERFSLVNLQQAIIQDPVALTRFLLDPDIWTSEDDLIIWQYSMEVIVELMETSTFASFNIKQLQRTRFLKRLFFMLMERSQDFVAKLPADIAVTVSALVMQLIGSPANTAEVIALWDFIFLTHPASSSYLNYRIVGHSDWLDVEIFNQDSIRLDDFDSKLAVVLRQMINSLGREKFANMLKSDDGTVFALETIQTSLPAQQPNFLMAGPDLAITVIGDSENVQQHLPDLVCDIDANAAASAEMSDSMRTATQSTTDDEGLLADEYLDAESEAAGDVAKQAILMADANARWLVETRAELLWIMARIITKAAFPIHRRLAGSIKWEHLLVLLRRQNNSSIRTAIITILCCMLKRLDAEQKAQFLKMNGFALVANQLREYPCSAEAINALFSFVCADGFRSQDGLECDVSVRQAIDKFQMASMKPLLVAFEGILDDPTLFCNMANIFCKLFEQCAAIAVVMLESHISEVLANILVHLCGRLDCNKNDPVKTDELMAMLEAWRLLLNVVLHRCVISSNVLHHQTFCDLMQLLFCSAILTQKLGSEAHAISRKELCVSIQLAFESMRQVLNDDSSTGTMSSISKSLISDIRSRTTSSNSGRTTPVLPDGEYSSSLDDANCPLDGERGISSSRRSSFSSFSSLKDRLFNLSQGNISQALRKTEQITTATPSELLERWRFLFQYSNEYLTFFTPCDSYEERHLIDYLLQFSMNSLANEGGARKRGNSWQMVTWSLRLKLQQLLSHCLVFVLYPAASNLESVVRRDLSRDSRLELQDRSNWEFVRRVLVVEAFAHEPQAKTVLKVLMDSIQECGSVVAVALYELLLCDNRLTDGEKADCRKLLKILQQLKIKTPLDGFESVDEILHGVCLDERSTLDIFQTLKLKWLERMRNFATRIRERHQNNAQVLSDVAMTITCAVVEEQNLPRKLFIQLKKQGADNFLIAEEHLRGVVMDLCHPAGSCFDSASWPSHWCLDPTEGPHRERRRLTPMHLNIPEKFIVPESRNHLASVNEKKPLSKLLSNFSDGVASIVAGQLVERLRIEDKIMFNCGAMVIRTSFECDGELLLGDRALYFVGESARSTQKGLPLDSVMTMSWSYGMINAVHKRYFQLIDLAIEIFFCDGETYLMAFESKEKREQFLNRLFAVDLPNLTKNSEHLLQKLTSWWREGNLTNFEYLMQLNTLAGRTFNDLMQYPVFPFVLSDYTSMALNLNSFSVFRNLAKPIAIQDVQMESHYLHVYRSLDNDFKRVEGDSLLSDLMPILGAYHYGSHYSNSGIVSHYLVRLPPFTQLALEYQDNSFDLPDRAFHNVSTAYRLSTSESTTDFKELIPEFFFLQEFLTNTQGLQLGHRQNGQSISDVELPPWCPASDPRLFILVHRQALESTYVTAHLHEWIDLIFGYKQIGQAAIDAINVFHPATYHGTLTAAACSDEIRLKALNTMVKTYGQMPQQLFKTPHLPHLIAQSYLTSSSMQKLQTILPSVSGIRWGQFVGSPDSSDPVLVLKQRTQSGFSKPVRLIGVADGSCVGVPAKCEPIILYGSIKKDLLLANVRDVEKIFSICWGFSDKIVRLRPTFPPDAINAGWINIISLHDVEITAQTTCPGMPLIFFGLKTGSVRIFKLDLIDNTVKSCSLVRTLFAHTSSVTVITACGEYSVFVTCSDKGECYVWDLNKMSFIRALRRHEDSVTHAVISKTTCDIVTCGLKGWGSELVLQTTNGRVVGVVETDIVITSVAVSTAPEGTAVNCIAAGMQNGTIRLWNMWTMEPVREISHSYFLESIVGLCYSHNCSKLYACTKSGAVLCWAITKQMRSPRYFFLNVDV